MNFIKYRTLFFIISALVIVPGIISLFLYGLKPSIDFTGGSLLEVAVQNPATSQQIEEVANQSYKINSVQSSGDNRFILKGSQVDQTAKRDVLEKLSGAFGDAQELRFEIIGPTLSKELLKKTYVAIAIVALVITLYLGRQFKELKYGLCAVIAMLHDSLVLVGCFSLFGHFYGVETDVLFVTAVLTTLSFSVHDTIVVYHRIRELKQKHVHLTLEETMNTAVNGTIVRSLNNSLTIILMLVALTLLGGSSIHWFAVALLIGSITGTYSSIFTAIPLLYVWEKWSERRKHAVAKK